jgi:hypothetical protein
VKDCEGQDAPRAKMVKTRACQGKAMPRTGDGATLGDATRQGCQENEIPGDKDTRRKR